MPPEDVIAVPYPRLAPETLRAVIEEFVTRDTTDYGLYEKSLDQKVADVMRQLERRGGCLRSRSHTLRPVFRVVVPNGWLLRPPRPLVEAGQMSA